MKKIITTLILFSILTIAGKAQSFDQGQILLFGNSNLKLTIDDGTPWNLNVGGGYFIKDNICLGLNIYAAGASGESDFSFSPFGRYYFLEHYYGGVSLIKGYGDDGKTKYYAQLEAGYIYALNDYVAIEPNLKYLIIDGAPLVLGVNISIYIGD